MRHGAVYLLINTGGGDGTVALAGAAGVLAAATLPERGTSEHLMPAVRRVLAGVRVSELAGLGVVLGPGSFTGLRVGLSAAKGLCEAGRVGMIGMSRLALVARCVEDSRGEVMALLDAGRGEFYGGLYVGAAMVWERLLRRDEAEAEMAGRLAVSCETRVGEALGGEVRLVSEPGAEALLAMVEARVRAGEWSDVASVDARYLRRTDAEIAASAGGGFR